MAAHAQQPPACSPSASARVQIEALSDLTGTLSLAREGRTVAEAEGTERWSGGLALDLADAAGQPVALQVGDRLLRQAVGEAGAVLSPHRPASAIPRWT